MHAHLARPQEGTNVEFAASLLALPSLGVAIAGTALTDVGMQVFGSISAAVILAGLVFIWKAIKSSNRHEVEEIVRRVITEELVDMRERLTAIERQNGHNRDDGR